MISVLDQKRVEYAGLQGWDEQAAGRHGDVFAKESGSGYANARVDRRVRRIGARRKAWPGANLARPEFAGTRPRHAELATRRPARFQGGSNRNDASAWARFETRTSAGARADGVGRRHRSEWSPRFI